MLRRPVVGKVSPKGSIAVWWIKGFHYGEGVENGSIGTCEVQHHPVAERNDMNLRRANRVPIAKVAYDRFNASNRTERFTFRRLF